MKLRIRHAKLGKVRFTSHRDTASHWERALRKASLPVVYSNGFTPRPKVSFGLGLPTGAESLAEFLDIDLIDVPECSLDDLCPQLTAALPVGYEVTRIEPRPDGAVSLQEDVVACSWEMHVRGASRPALDEAVAAALGGDALMVERERKGKRSIDNVRPAVLTLGVSDGAEWPVLTALLATTGRGLRPTELIAALAPHLDALDAAARVLRTEQWIERDGEMQALMPLATVAHAHAASA